jgi:hypothetical protein|tara:strand:- start:344 stop:610 length:267 start_codon:yes stop_codon:yes gene_type:complete
MKHSAPHPDQISYFRLRTPGESYATVKRAMRRGYCYPLKLTFANLVYLKTLDDDVFDMVAVLPLRSYQHRETVWFADAGMATYAKLMI